MREGRDGLALVAWFRRRVFELVCALCGRLADMACGPLNMLMRCTRLCRRTLNAHTRETAETDRGVSDIKTTVIPVGKPAGASRYPLVEAIRRFSAHEDRCRNPSTNPSAI